MMDARAARRIIMRLRIEGHILKILLRDIRRPGKVGSMGSGIGEIPHISLLIIMANIREQHRLARNHLKKLHRQSAVHIRLRRRDNRLMRPVPVIRIV